MNEIWKDIIGYEGLYQVSNLGNIKSLGNGGTHKTERILSQKITRFGYKTVILHKNGVRKDCRVHRLVAYAFLPNDDDTLVVNHKDGDKCNNRVENLEWCTQSDNVIHAYENNLHNSPSGEKHWNCKLTEAEVNQIRKEYIKYDYEFGSGGLSKKYGVSSRAIRDIVNGRRRKGVAI